MPSKRSRTYRETSELLAATRRMLVAIGKRAADEDAELVTELVQLERQVNDVTRYTVLRMRDRGVTWQEIGDAVGTTRQAALMRWGGTA